MSQIRTYGTTHEEGPATVWKHGRQIAEGFLRATIVREYIVSADGSRAEGVPDYRARLENLSPSLYDLSDVEVRACGRIIPCDVNRGVVRPSGEISPAL